MATFTAGDVRRRTHLNGVTEYIRIGGPNPDGTAHVFVMTCRPDGHTIAGTGRYLLATTITTRYQPAPTPREKYRA